MRCGECVSQAADWVDWLQKDAGVKKHKLIRAQTGMVAVNWLGFFSHGPNISLGKWWRLKMELQREPAPRKWWFGIANKQLCAKVFNFSPLHLERDGHHDYWPQVVYNRVIYHGLGMWGWSQTQQDTRIGQLGGAQSWKIVGDMGQLETHQTDLRPSWSFSALGWHTGGYI